MSKFKLNTMETAPEESKEILSAELEKNGFLPNLYGIMSESPELLKAYKQMQPHPFQWVPHPTLSD